MTGQQQTAVNMYDIRRDKHEESLLGTLKQNLNADPQTMPTLLLYDEKGLKIFEEITYLDEYYLTNAEIELLHKHATRIAEHIPAGARVIELGSGNLRKVRILLEALEKAKKHVDYFALDLSKVELERTFEELKTSEFQYVNFNSFHGTYDDGLAWLSKPENQDRINCVMTLGSSIGNFDRTAAAKFLQGFSEVLRAGDLVIVGVDGASNTDRIFRAYNDSKGVTERFYRNGLEHANAILGYEAFKQNEWAVRGKYDKDEHKHEALYVALTDVKTQDFSVKKDTELSFEHAYKYTQEQSDQLWHDAGLIPQACYSDSTNEYHLHVLRPAHIGFATSPSEYAKTPVPSVQEWQQLWTAWDTVTRSMVPRDELMNKPIQLRNNLIFYLGHIPTFADIHYTKATATKPTDPAYFYQIFERGIDPDVDNPEVCHDHSEIPDEWPPLDEILGYQLSVRNRIIKAVESGQAVSDRRLARGLWLAYEHEAMHLETFLYMLLQSERILSPPGQTVPDFAALSKESASQKRENIWHKIPERKFVVGADDPENNLPPDRYYLWDNERPSRLVSVKSFEAQSRPISNGDYANYLEATHQTKLPASWISTSKATNGVNGVNGIQQNGDAQTPSKQFLSGKAIRTVYGPVPLEFVLDWPVMASYDELAAFAKWLDGRIPTLDELNSIYDHVHSQKSPAENTSSTLVPAVNGHLSNDGVEETPPKDHLSSKGADSNVSSLNPADLFIDLHGLNVGFKHWMPTPITADGDRLRGRCDVGGLWEWTSTALAAHEGFRAMDLYPGYTADFFDDKHNICLGGSWATVPRIAGRKSFVNWYQRNYPYVWCTARLVRDAA